MPTAESEPIISLLKNAIRLSNYTYRDVERQLGWRVGTITRLLRGGLGLKIEHLLSILRAIGFSPGRFFAAAYPNAAGAAPAEDRLYRTLEQMYGEPDGARTGMPRGRGASGSHQGGQGGDSGNSDEIDRIDEMVQASLRRLIGIAGPEAGEPDRGS
jgi:transcriptional regulator with XRE-family HTH domain